MFTYIASPYSHPVPDVMRERYREAMKFTAWLLNRGEVAFSPIVHAHQMSITENLPHGFDFWEAIDCAMIASGKSVTVLTIPGWDESVGVRAELKFARLLGKPIRFANPSTLLDYVIHPE